MEPFNSEHDKFNQNLISDVFPSNWKNPKPAEIYDLVILGTGPGGMAAATFARKKKCKSCDYRKRTSWRGFIEPF